MARILIELLTGPNKQHPIKRDIDRNIDAIDRALKNCNGVDVNILLDTRSILEGIKNKLPEYR